MDHTTSCFLYTRARQGEDDALATLVERHHEWLWRYVRRRMTARHRRLETSEDVVQEVLRKLVQRGPRFVPEDEDQFRRLLATIVVNRLNDRFDYLNADKRAADRERRLEDESRAQELPSPSVDRPSRVVGRQEEEERLRLAMELIDPDEAEALRLRNWESLSFPLIGERLGMTEDQARMACRKATLHLGAMLRRLEAGQLVDTRHPPEKPSGRA